MADKKLTQIEESRNIIKGGGAVLLKVNGKKKIFSMDNIEELPTDADMAMGNPELSRMAIGDIDDQIEQLQAQKKQLSAANKDDEKKASKSDEANASPVKKEESK